MARNMQVRSVVRGKQQSTTRVGVASQRKQKSTQRMSATGYRTLLHLTLSQDVVDDVDTLLWLRVAAAGDGVEAIRGGKNQIYDEAVKYFLRRYERRQCAALALRQPVYPWRTLWVSTTLVDRCRNVAKRDEVAVGRVVGYALTNFVEQRVTPSWREFRREVCRQASALLAKS